MSLMKQDQYYPKLFPMKISSIAPQVKYEIRPSQGDGWLIKTEYGYIDYRHVDGTNEIWWIESKKRGHGSELIDLMQTNHPAESIAWGVTSQAGEALMKKWHNKHPNIECITGPHENQFDPFE